MATELYDHSHKLFLLEGSFMGISWPSIRWIEAVTYALSIHFTKDLLWIQLLCYILLHVDCKVSCPLNLRMSEPLPTWHWSTSIFEIWRNRRRCSLEHFRLIRTTAAPSITLVCCTTTNRGMAHLLGPRDPLKCITTRMLLILQCTWCLCSVVSWSVFIEPCS